jgi:stress response protein SCP2
MIELTQGQRLPVASLTTSRFLHIDIGLRTQGLAIDLACFGLDANGKLSDDRYMIFFNQTSSPCSAVMQQNGSSYSVSLDQLPASIDKLVFTAAIDGDGILSQLGASQITVRDPVNPQARCDFSGASFDKERAIILAELYRKNGEWRLVPVLQGFNDGLEALVHHFGGQVVDPSPAPSQSSISLEKKVGDVAPELLSLAKKAQVSLEKADLTHVIARVGLVLDASGSMNEQYRGGKVQEVVNRLLPLAVHFDDDGEIDCWAFGEKTQALTPVTLSNYREFVAKDNGGWKKWRLGARYNCEHKAIHQVIDHYSRTGDRTPAYVLFISDGGVHEGRKIKEAMIQASRLPIFWQFVGIGGSQYGILEHLDEMEGRLVDNCNFFALDDLHDVSEEELYERLMAEFPEWLKLAANAGVID